MQDSRIKDTNNAIKLIRKLGYLVPGAEFDVAGDNDNGPAIYYSLTGPDDEIGPAAEKVAQFLRTVPGAVNVQTSAENGAPRMNVDVDRAKCELLGINPSDVATVARIAVDGAVATKVRTPTGLVDVRVQFPAADRKTEDALKYVKVRANDGSLVPIGDVASFSWTTAPTKIERLNRERVVNVYGDMLPGYSLGQVVGPLQKKMQTPGFLPQGVGLKSQGNSQFMEETFANMGVALITSFMLVYILMVILYGSFLEPLIVMFSVPLAIIGALILLALMGRLQPEQGQSLNIISMLGVIMLFGLVAKNGILLVDYSNTLVKRGMRVHDAVLQASATRFRPIIMTTAAMIFGMLPLALGYAEGGEWRQAMGTVIIGGLLSSLILTLFLVPMIYETWIGYFERRADRRAIEAEMSQPWRGRLPKDVILSSVEGRRALVTGAAAGLAAGIAPALARDGFSSVSITYRDTAPDATLAAIEAAGAIASAAKIDFLEDPTLVEKSLDSTRAATRSLRYARARRRPARRQALRSLDAGRVRRNVRR